MSQQIEPVHAPYTGGEPFEFGTHSNDFLLHRENALATETFTVRVPAGRAVPEHVHTDMEQTFVFISGIGAATLRSGGDVRQHRCRPGDTLFVPTGWHHTVAAPGLEGCVYVTVNAFVAEAERIGASATEHAEIAAAGFRANTAATAAAVAAEPDAAALLRCAEAAFRLAPGSTRMWPQDFTQFDATLTGDPGSYRVRRLGPFEYVETVTPVPRVLDAALADRLHHAVDGMLPLYVEGSQSPLSVKPPCSSSDLDVLLVVESAADAALAHKALQALETVRGDVPVPLSPGVVHAQWLGLPNFYSALSLDPASPDRRWWTADPEQLRAEAARRQHEGLKLLHDPAYVREVLDRTLAVMDPALPGVTEWRITPRWRGYV
ncbi:cupin domain-containing protein [Streptomyces sp. OUCMDZ-4982]|uniref:cupin domain-containing protein n=1 Tax=Streptomyces sp. OUCMDZ-4982 TaxID=2973090 RepID=UPI00215C312C|nr:cupin domain-containing protein [Streptomyces sp. OUCMDZ-4982]MCR8945115.1 cupin domain-containing protein [Streptomyces sp. OUCMDZ-4982]